MHGPKGFLVEPYVPRMGGAAVEHGAPRPPARRPAEELTLQGTPVRYVRSIDVSEDETCLLLFQTASAAARGAALTFEHVAKAVKR